VERFLGPGILQFLLLLLLLLLLHHHLLLLLLRRLFLLSTCKRISTNMLVLAPPWICGQRPH
jgi:hypothetical protein